MHIGTQYTFKSVAFPRYEFFETRINSLLPRWQRIVDASDLTACISDGVTKNKSISAAADTACQQPSVCLFAEDKFLRTHDLIFSVETDSSTIGDVSQQTVTWLNMKEKVKESDFFQPTVIVFAQSEFDSKIFQDLSDLTDDQLSCIIFYNTETKTNVRYVDLEKAGFNLENLGTGNEKQVARRSSLSAQIQYVLEEKAVAVLELITDFIHPFVPKAQRELDYPLNNIVTTGLDTGFNDEFVVKDLYPEKTEAPITGRQMTDKEFNSIVKIFGFNYHLLSDDFGLTIPEMQKIYKDGKDSDARTLMCLKLWRDKVGEKATQLKLLEAVNNVNDRGLVTFDTGELISILQTDEDRNDLFQRALVEFVVKKSRTLVCSNLSTKYGIAEHIINEFLNEGFYGFEKTIRLSLDDLELPDLPQDKEQSLVDVCRNFSYFVGLSKRFLEAIQKTDDYVRRKLYILEVMLKLQFELFAMLRLTDVQINIYIPPLTMIPKGLQESLLELENVKGCGTFYGELWLHLAKPLSSDLKNEIVERLEAYNFNSVFKWGTKPSFVEQARGIPIEPGQSLRARNLVNQQHSHGSLGCFITVSPKAENIGATKMTKVSDAYLVQNRQTHAVTCAHCVKDCDENIEVMRGTTFIPFGRKKFEIYRPHAIDVATIEVRDPPYRYCSSILKKFNELGQTNEWECFSDNPSGRQVQKEGSGSTQRFTRGIVICPDYRTGMYREHNLQRFRGNVLIESLPDVPEGTDLMNLTGPIVPEPFSEPGDSGAVVCCDNPDRNAVFIVSLLMGALTSNTPDLPPLRCSYSSRFDSTLEQLRVDYDVDIEPAILS